MDVKSCMQVAVVLSPLENIQDCVITGLRLEILKLVQN